MKRVISALIILGLSSSTLFGGNLTPRRPGAADKCPVCGMFVAKYPNHAAQIRFRDGACAFFDGAKDMFKYYFAPDRYNPGRKRADIATLLVTDYYTLEYIDAYSAWYVVGSDVHGPMGNEPIPLAGRADALEFKQDHRGSAILRFKDVTDSVIKGMD